MNKSFLTVVMSGILLLMVARTGVAAIYDFNFTGRFTVVNPDGSIFVDPGNAGVLDPIGMQAPISASLRFDTTLGIGSASLIVAPFDFLGGTSPLTIHSMLLEDIGNNLILGNFLGDWDTYTNLPVSVVWDATGLFNAFSSAPGGLQVGDVISGNVLKRDGTVINADLGSAIPATDGMIVTERIGRTGSVDYVVNQGPAPMAMTTWNTTPLCTPTIENTCEGVNPSGGYPLVNDGLPGSPMIGFSFEGTNINIDIGSGNSMTVTGVSAVPLAPSLWLFISGLLGLSGLARRKKV